MLIILRVNRIYKFYKSQLMLNKSIFNLSRLGYLFTHSKSLKKPANIDYKTDSYRSVHLTPSSQKINDKQFKQYLSLVMKAQIDGNNILTNPQKQTNAVWVHLNKNNLSLVENLVNEHGFVIHHGIGDKISVNKWIAKKKDLITGYSTFYISAGAVIIHDEKVFLVQEKNGQRKGDFGVPGGRADFGETISSCAERQLLQQTNISAKFNYILHFRELQKTAYNAMDIYFACVMQFDPTTAFNSIKLCERELSTYKWVHLSQYEQFCQKNSVGTQYQLSKYLSKLYKNGYDFKVRKPNQTTFQKYTSPRDKVQRLVAQHGLVQGIEIDKAYP